MNKKYIIDEIKRTAKENNDVPLGANRFKMETGINETEWCGKYWTKWGDALIEAGYQPNKMQEAYGEEFLIKKIIDLIRKLKKFPTVREIKLNSFQDKNFPSQGPFRNALGTKNIMVTKIIKYCEDKDELLDILTICQNVLEKKEEENYNELQKKETFGYVYLMKSGRFYKIGKANCVEKRNYEIGIKLPEESKIIHKIRTDDPFGIEAYWHKRFESKRKQGEWFDLSASDIEAFKKWKRIA